jgi:hypothetical protein
MNTLRRFISKIVALDLEKAKPLLKYRESLYTVAELERRLIAEVNGFRR